MADRRSEGSTAHESAAMIDTGYVRLATDRLSAICMMAIWLLLQKTVAAAGAETERWHRGGSRPVESQRFPRFSGKWIISLDLVQVPSVHRCSARLIRSLIFRQARVVPSQVFLPIYWSAIHTCSSFQAKTAHDKFAQADVRAFELSADSR